MENGKIVYRVMYGNYSDDCYAECDTLEKAKQSALEYIEDDPKYFSNLRIEKVEIITRVKKAKTTIVWDDDTCTS